MHPFIILLALLQLAGLATARAQGLSGYAIFVKEYEDFDERASITDTLYFNGEQILYVEKRDKIEFYPKPRFQFSSAARDQSWCLDLTTLEVIFQQRNFRKGTYERTASRAEPFQWQLHDEFRTIDGYRVQKATAPRSDDYQGMTAWFTTEVPVSAGPYRTWGLPGLIIELQFHYDFRSAFRLQSIVYQPVGDLTPTEGAWVEREEDGADRRRLRDLLNKDN